MCMRAVREGGAAVALENLMGRPAHTEPWAFLGWCAWTLEKTCPRQISGDTSADWPHLRTSSRPEQRHLTHRRTC